MDLIHPFEITLEKFLSLSATDYILLDVRQPFEHAAGNLGGRLIPLNELPAHINELDRNKLIIIYCRSGKRSLKAAEWLREQGFDEAYSLRGGVLQTENTNGSYLYRLKVF